MFHGGDLKFSRCGDNASEPFYQPDVRAPYFSLPLVVGGLLLRSISFGAEPQVFVRRRVGEPARSPNGLKLDKETTPGIVRWTRVVLK